MFEGAKTRLIHVRGNFETKAVADVVATFDKNARLRSENYSKDVVDVLFVTKIKEASDLIAQLRKLQGVTGVSSIEHTEGQF